MNEIVVYFRDGHKVVFERDKVAFMDGNGSCFAFSEYYTESEYMHLLDDGKAIVNWDNVCWVKEHVAADQDEDL